MGLYLVFFSCEIPELACDDRLADKFRQFLLVIDILILLLNAEYGGFSGTVAGTEEDVPPEGREWSPVIRIVLFLYLTFLVFVIDLRAPAHHVHRIVVEQLELAVQFRYVVARGRSGVKNLILEPSEYAQDVSCAL